MPWAEVAVCQTHAQEVEVCSSCVECVSCSSYCIGGSFIVLARRASVIQEEVRTNYMMVPETSLVCYSCLSAKGLSCLLVY